jgi:hypothetical protein
LRSIRPAAAISFSLSFDALSRPHAQLLPKQSGGHSVFFADWNELRYVALYRHLTAVTICFAILLLNPC